MRLLQQLLRNFLIARLGSQMLGRRVRGTKVRRRSGRWSLLPIIPILGLILAWQWLRRPMKAGPEGDQARHKTGAPGSLRVDTQSTLAKVPPTETRPRVQQAIDDLTRITGIGPKISNILQTAGIRTYAGLGKLEPHQLEQILEEAGLRAANTSTWPEQARLAARGDWETLESLKHMRRGSRNP